MSHHSGRSKIVSVYSSMQQQKTQEVPRPDSQSSSMMLKQIQEANAERHSNSHGKAKIVSVYSSKNNLNEQQEPGSNENSEERGFEDDNTRSVRQEQKVRESSVQVEHVVDKQPRKKQRAAKEQRVIIVQQ